MADLFSLARTLKNQIQGLRKKEGELLAAAPPAVRKMALDAIAEEQAATQVATDGASAPSE